MYPTYYTTFPSLHLSASLHWLMLLRMDWSMLSKDDREGVLQYATTLCNTVTETVTAMSTQVDKGADKGSKKHLSIDQDQDNDKNKASFYAPLSPAAAIACLSQLHALGDNKTMK